MSEKPPVVVSRCDRLGDLILSLPVLGFLRDAGFETRVLHCSRYAEDVGRWALFNGLCAELWLEDDPVPNVLTGGALGLALFHSPTTVKAFRRAKLARTFGSRNKLSALWSYDKSVAQHRSRVEKSEMYYNVDLARAFVRELKIPEPDFRGLPALALPPEWSKPERAPDFVCVVSNNGSAANWPLENYLAWAREHLRRGRKVDFLVSGLDAEARSKQIEASGILREGARIVSHFSQLRNLIVYLASAKEIISSSTGPLHLAHAAGVAVTGVYPEAPLQQTFARWRPDGYWHDAPVRFLNFKS